MRTVLLVVPYLLAVSLNAAAIWFGVSTVCMGPSSQPAYAYADAWPNALACVAFAICGALVFVGTHQLTRGMLRRGDLDRSSLRFLYGPLQLVGCFEILGLGGLAALCASYGLIAITIAVFGMGPTPGFLEDGGRLFLTASALILGALCKLGPSADIANGVGI